MMSHTELDGKCGQVKVIHLIPSIGTVPIGTALVALNLAREQQARGYEASVWTLGDPNALELVSEASGLKAGSVHGFKRCGPQSLCHSSELNRAAHRESTCKIIHQHGLWTFMSRSTNIMRSSHRLSTVICPHGALQAWALRKSKWKKQIALLSYEGKNLRNATCLHAVGAHEVEAFRDFGLTNPVAVIPVGISQATLNEEGSKKRFREKFHIPDDCRVALYLSRITPKKGLPMLMEALDAIRSSLENWKVIIAGMDEFNHEKEVKELVKCMALDRIVKFVGPLYDVDKADAFAAAEVFILPSHSEGNPMVVLEALSFGVPVLTTRGSSWSELVEERCGWWTEISSESLVAGLSDALHLTQSELVAMGERGRELIRRKYTWDRLAVKTVRLYKWLLEGGTVPDFVVLG